MQGTAQILTLSSYLTRHLSTKVFKPPSRYTRQYEIGYIDEVIEAVSGDPRIQLYEVTTDVDQYYSIADVLLFTSVNEVTPMVISEAMSYGIPIISTNIAGIIASRVHITRIVEF